MKRACLKLVVLTLAVLVGHQSYAQSLRIQYDFLNDEVKYFKTKPGDPIGKEITKPVVGRKSIVNVEVINFNRFVYAANATYTSQVVENQTEIGLMDLVSPLVNPMGASGFFSSLGGVLPEGVGRGGVLSTRGASSAYDDIVDSYRNLTRIESSVQSIDYVVKKLNKLKYSPYLPADTIKNMCMTMVGRVFDKSVVNPSDFASIVDDWNKELDQSMASLRSASQEFLSEYSDYAKRNSDGFEGKGLDITVKRLNAEVERISKTFNADLIRDQVDYLEAVYTSIIATRYSFKSSHAANDDEIELLLDFYRKPQPTDDNQGTVDVTTLPKIKEKKIYILVQGDLKVTTSIGLGFPKLNSNSEFVNRDSIIFAQEGSAFSPYLTGYINFYPYTGRTLQLGGTFGVGVPMQQNRQNVTMMGGLTALLGSDSRVAFHTGVALGQVQKLGEGLSVGDKLLSTSQDVPVRDVWETGWFVGISFNIGQNPF